MEGSVASFREPSVKIKESAVPKRHRVQRIVKKHLQQKYLLCGFAIHAFIASPAFLYGIIIESDQHFVVRIWPGIIYQAIGQICQSIILAKASNDKDKGITDSLFMKKVNTNRKIFISGTVLLCCALTVSGGLYTSAWTQITITTQIIAVIIYGILGGIGSSIIFCRTILIIQAVRPKEDLYVQKTIHLCGEAFCQLFLSFVFTTLRTLYGQAQTLVLMASMMINFIPLSLLITRHHEEPAVTLRIPTAIVPPEHRFGMSGTANNLELFSKSNSLKSIDKLDGLEMQQKLWKNPLANANNNNNDYNYLQVQQNDEDDYFYYNSSKYYENGVQIMEIIPEEDENVSIMRSSTATIDNHSRIISMGQSVPSCLNENIEDEKNNENSNTDNNGYANQFQKNYEIFLSIKNEIKYDLLELFIKPLRKSIVIFKLYPATLLQSADIFTYVMCLTVLPGIAINLHALKLAEIPFLFSLLAFPWMCFALMTPRFGHVLVKKNIKWHAAGCMAKSLGLTFISFSTSKLLLSVSSVLLGFGQAVSLFLQEGVIKSSMPTAQWKVLKFSLNATNGILILIWGGLAHLVVLNFSLQAAVGLSAIIYIISIIIWFVVYFCVRL